MRDSVPRPCLYDPLLTAIFVAFYDPLVGVCLGFLVYVIQGVTGGRVWVFLGFFSGEGGPCDFDCLFFDLFWFLGDDVH